MSDGSGAIGDTIKFFLDGEEVEARPGETIWQVANRQGTEIPHLCYSPAPFYRPDGNCRACMVEIEGERVLAASCIRKPSPGMKVKSASDRAKFSRQMVFELLVADQPDRQAHPDPDSRFWKWADRVGVSQSRFPAHASPRARPLASGDGGQARRLHRMQSLRPRLPRGPGQRRHRHGQARPRGQDRVRFRRSDGRQHLRRLRRMRPGLPDRRADAGPGRERSRACWPRSPTARSKASAPIAASAARSPTRSRTTSCSMSTAATARPIATGFASRAASASTTSAIRDRLTEAADPQGRRRRSTAIVDIDPAQSLDPFPRSHLGRGARRSRRRAEAHPRGRTAPRASPASARPRARMKRPISSRSWSAPASAPTTSITARGSATPPRWRALLEGIGSGAVTAPFTAAKDADLIIVIGANPTENHPVAATFFKNAAKRGATLIVMDPRGQALEAPRHPHAAIQSRPATCRCSRPCSTSSSPRTCYDKQYVQAHTEDFEKLAGKRQGPHAREDGADLRHRRRDAQDRGAQIRPRRSRHHLLGHGHLAAHPRHRQHALPDRAGADHRPDRPARHRAPSAARPEQRAGRVGCGPDPDVLSRLPIGRESRSAPSSTRISGAPSSTPSAASPWSRS